MPPPLQPHDIALKLWVVLARAFDAVEHHSRSSIARFGLGTTEFGVLEVLYHKGELAVDAVAFADLPAARAAEARVERDDCAGALAVDGLRRLGDGRGLLGRSAKATAS